MNPKHSAFMFDWQEPRPRTHSVQALGVITILLSSCVSGLPVKPSPPGEVLYEARLSDSGAEIAEKSVYSSPTTEDTGAECVRVTALESYQHLMGFDVSPDGETIIMSLLIKVSAGFGGASLWTKDLREAPGAGLTQITDGPSYDITPRFAPDGRAAYFSSNRNRGNAIYRADVREKSGYWLVSMEGSITSHPDIDAKGTKLIFASYNPGNKESYIWSKPLGDGTQRQIGRGAQGRWSPDGSQIVCSIKNVSSGSHDIWVVDADGANQKRLTSSVSDDIDPAWSPDGKRIIFASNRSRSQYQGKQLGEGPEESYNFDIVLMNADGSGVRHLTSNASLDDQPRWRNEGQVLFRSNRGKKWDVWELKVPGQQGGK